MALSENPLGDLLPWNQTRIRIYATVGIIFPLVGAILFALEHWAIGAALCLLGVVGPALMPTAISQILLRKKYLDERELALRAKAYEFSYKVIVASTVLLFATTLLNQIYDKASESPASVVLIFFVWIYYTTAVPVAYLAWKTPAWVGPGQ